MAALVSSGAADHDVATAPSSSLIFVNKTVTPVVWLLIPAYR